MQSLLTKHKLKFFQQTRNQVFMHACMQPTPTESIVTCRCQILHFTLFSKLRNMHEQLPFVGNLPRKYLYIVLIGQHRVHCLHTLPTYLTRTQCDGIKNVLRWNESFNAQWWEWNPPFDKAGCFPLASVVLLESHFLIAGMVPGLYNEQRSSTTIKLKFLLFKTWIQWWFLSLNIII